MKKLCGIAFFAAGFMGVTEAGQLLVANKTNKTVVLSLTFFQTAAEKEMKIKDFSLESMQKTKFPQDKDKELALPLKLKVKIVGADASVAQAFEKDDLSVHDLDIVEHEGVLKLIQKKTEK